MSYKGLGRIKVHDPRSRKFPVEELPKSKIVSRVHPRHIPILDQGQLGSCTGNAQTGNLATGDLWLGLGTMQTELNNHGEQFAVHLYSMATHLDRYRGYYPPDDTGSSGLYVAKAAYKLGLTTGYRHVFSLMGLVSALQSRALIVGTEWDESMNEPDHNGFVVPDGNVEGGHEYLCREYVRVNDKDPIADENVLVFDNSWGTGWGQQGRFKMELGVFKTLLIDRRGDATVSLPLPVKSGAETPDHMSAGPLADGSPAGQDA